MYDDEHFGGSVFSGFSGYGLGSADLGWVYVHIWDLMFSVALAGIMGISALFLRFSFQQAHQASSHGHAQE